jgi:hypothetical protein
VPIGYLPVGIHAGSSEKTMEAQEVRSDFIQMAEFDLGYEK